MSTNTFVLPIAVATAVFVVLQRRRSLRLSGYRLSQFWCLFWGLIGIAGMASALVSFWRVNASRAAAGSQPDDVPLSILSMMSHISVALALIGCVGFVVSAIYFFASQRQRRNYAA